MQLIVLHGAVALVHLFRFDLVNYWGIEARGSVLPDVKWLVCKVFKFRAISSQMSANKFKVLGTYA